MVFYRDPQTGRYIFVDAFISGVGSLVDFGGTSFAAPQVAQYGRRRSAMEDTIALYGDASRVSGDLARATARIGSSRR